MSGPTAPATIIDLGRLIEAIDRHRCEIDDFHVSQAESKEGDAFEGACDRLHQAVVLLQDEVLGMRATSIAEAVIQSELAFVKADEIVNSELGHQFATGRLKHDLTLIYRALISIVPMVAATLPVSGAENDCARNLIRRTLPLLADLAKGRA